jgi:hypothetical protein
MAPTIVPARPRELGDDDVAVICFAVVERAPDPDDYARGELASWLRRQERAETQAELAAAGLL